MTVTTNINKLLKGIDYGADFISIRVKSEYGNVIYSNMPDEYKKFYYTKDLKKIDDTFDRSEKNDNVIYPCSRNGYISKYVSIMEDAGFFNQSAITIKSNLFSIGIITTSGECYSDFDSRYSNYKNDIMKSAFLIINYYIKEIEKECNIDSCDIFGYIRKFEISTKI